MHAITYLVCFFFFKELKGISKQRENGMFWSFVYAVALFLFLRFDPTAGMFLSFGRPSPNQRDQYLEGDYWQATVLDISAIEATFVCLVLGVLFYFTSQLGGHMSMRSFRIAFVLVPGLIINSFASYFLISVFL